MKTIILDSDGLIKLAKAGVLGELSRKYLLVITGQVHNEVVIKGKAHGHKEAEEIEEMIKTGIIQVRKTSLKGGNLRLGEGERSCFQLYSRKAGGFIVSDDQAFLRYLEFHGVPFVLPTDLIAVAARRGVIPVERAKEALLKIQNLVRKDNLERAMKRLEGAE